LQSEDVSQKTSKSRSGSPVKYQCGYDWKTSDDSQSEEDELFNNDEASQEEKENIFPVVVSFPFFYVSLSCR